MFCSLRFSVEVLNPKTYNAFRETKNGGWIMKMSKNNINEKISEEEFYIRKITELLRKKPEINFLRQIYTIIMCHIGKEQGD